MKYLSSLLGVLALAGGLLLSPVTGLAEEFTVGSVDAVQSGLPVVGEVRYVHGQADIAWGGATLPVLADMKVPVGSTLTVHEGSQVHLEMLDGDFKKLKPFTQLKILRFNYDPAAPADSEVKFKLVYGEIDSKTGIAGKEARDKYRLDTPTASIGVLGTEFTVSVDKDRDTILQIHQGEVVMDKLGGDCPTSGFNACTGFGSMRLSDRQRHLALVLQANDFRPRLVPLVQALPSQSQAAPATKTQVAKSGESKDGKQAATENGEKTANASQQETASASAQGETQVADGGGAGSDGQTTATPAQADEGDSGDIAATDETTTAETSSTESGGGTAANTASGQTVSSSVQGGEEARMVLSEPESSAGQTVNSGIAGPVGNPLSESTVTEPPAEQAVGASPETVVPVDVIAVIPAPDDEPDVVAAVQPSVETTPALESASTPVAGQVNSTPVVSASVAPLSNALERDEDAPSSFTLISKTDDETGLIGVPTDVVDDFSDDFSNESAAIEEMLVEDSAGALSGLADEELVEVSKVEEFVEDTLIMEPVAAETDPTPETPPDGGAVAPLPSVDWGEWDPDVVVGDDTRSGLVAEQYEQVMLSPSENYTLNRLDGVSGQLPEDTDHTFRMVDSEANMRSRATNEIITPVDVLESDLIIHMDDRTFGASATLSAESEGYLDSFSVTGSYANDTGTFVDDGSDPTTRVNGIVGTDVDAADALLGFDRDIDELRHVDGVIGYTLDPTLE